MNDEVWKPFQSFLDGPMVPGNPSRNLANMSAGRLSGHHKGSYRGQKMKNFYFFPKTLKMIRNDLRTPFTPILEGFDPF